MRRTRFDDAQCPIARVTDLFGDWWTPLVLRDAMYGITRFEDFQHELGVSRAVLSQRGTWEKQGSPGRSIPFPKKALAKPSRREGDRSVSHG